MQSTLDPILSHLNEILASESFVRSKRLAQFLSWIVNQSISGQASSITERNIAMLVYGRPADFDAKVDGIVRSEAMRLRHKLREYYETQPADGPRIEIPKGTYAPLFKAFDSASEPEPSPSHGHPRMLLLCGVALLVVTCVVVAARHRKEPSAKSDALLADAERLRLAGDLPAAVSVLGKADADSPQVHLARATFQQLMGHNREARNEVAVSEELDAKQGRFDEAVEAREHALNQDQAGAYQRISATLPKQPASAGRLLDAALLSPDHQNALALIRAARRLPGGTSSPELDRFEALYLGALGENASGLDMARRAEAKAVAARATWSQARIVLLEAGLMMNLGVDAQTVAPVIQRARQLCHASADDMCEAQADRVEGNRLIGLGRFQDAIAVYRHGLPIAFRSQNWHETGNILAGIELASQRGVPQDAMDNILIYNPPDLVPRLDLEHATSPAR
jgi:tetratricopeptide (TPR) repeat protein